MPQFISPFRSCRIATLFIDPLNDARLLATYNTTFESHILTATKDPMMFRTILKSIALAFLFAVNVTQSSEVGFDSIFDGKTLKGWDGNPDFWSVKDGAITGITTPTNPTKGNTFIVWRGGEIADFELRLQFRIRGGNSGVQYRSKEVDKWVISGYQADFDGPGGWTGTLYEERGRGVLALSLIHI